MADDEERFEQHFYWTAAGLALLVHTTALAGFAWILRVGSDNLQLWQPWVWIDFPTSQLMIWTHPLVMTMFRRLELTESLLFACQLALFGGFQWFVICGSIFGQTRHRRAMAKLKADTTIPSNPFAEEPRS